MPLRIAIISDTHLPRGSRVLPEACTEQLRDADLILHAGDISTTQTLAELRELGPPVHAVAGNVDEPVLRECLPHELELELCDVRLAMTHDAGPSQGRLQRMRRRFPQATAVVFGHSHIPLCEHGDDGFQIFNPGSPTDRRRQPEHSMGVAHIESAEVRFEHMMLGS
jgi:putative phosphoesterase